MRKIFLWLAAFSLVFFGCKGDESGPPTDYSPKAELPQFTQQTNEVEIADSMNDMDPTQVLAALVEINTGLVRTLDSCLAENSTPIINQDPEVAFKDIVQNSLVINTTWLDFLTAKVSSNVRAEVSVIIARKTSLKKDDIDRARLNTIVGAIPDNERANYGVIIGYTDFILSATTFRDFGAEGQGNGYGVRLDGKWYSKDETISANHRIIATWAPLPFFSTSINTPQVTTKAQLDQLTRTAIRNGIITPRTLKTLRIRK